jgi:ankyrin repeat protein
MKARTLIAALLLGAVLAGNAQAKSLFLTEEFWETASPADVQAQIDAGGDLLERDKIGRQGLHYALRGHASLEVLRFVLEKGVPIRPKDGKGVYAELYAARYGDLDTIKLLEEFGADYQVADYMGETPQFWLSKNKSPNLRVVDYFVELGLDMNAQSRLGVTPAGATVLNKRGEELFDYLVELGSDPYGIDSEGRDMFMRALIGNDSAAMLERFYEDSEDPEAEDNYGLSGVLLASIEGISEDRLAFLED